MKILSFVVVTLLLTLTGLDLVTAHTSSATALMNVGPGLGSVVGPAGNFSSLSEVAKWQLCAGKEPSAARIFSLTSRKNGYK